MSDPLSLLALTAGLVSLGLQVYGGTVSYLDALKSRGEDVAAVSREVESLEHALVIIKSIAETESHQDDELSLAQIQSCLQSCHTEMASLKAFLDELIAFSNRGPSLSEKVKKQSRKLAFSFHRPKLELLQERLRRMNSILQLALQDLGLSTVRDSLPSIKTTVEALAPLINLQTGTLSAESLAINSSLQINIASVQSLIESSVVSRLELLELGQREQNANVTRIYESLNSGRSSSRMLGQLLAKPSDLKVLCDEVVSVERNLTNNFAHEQSSVAVATNQLSRNFTPGLSSYHCLCRDRRKFRRQATRWGSLELYGQETVEEFHFPDCARSQVVLKRHQKAWGMRYTGLISLLGKAVEISFAMTSGAGGGSMGPMFTYYATVDPTISPAFQVIGLIGDIARELGAREYIITAENETFRYQWLRSGQWQRLVETGSKKIQKLFRNRAASPTDLNPQNQSLVHWVAHIVSPWSFLPLPLAALSPVRIDMLIICFVRPDHT